MSLSPDEFVHLTLKHRSRFYGAVLAMMPGNQDVDDVVQETVSTMWQKVKTFEPGTDFGAWGCTIARFKVLEHIRKKKGSHVLPVEILELVGKEFIDDTKELEARSNALQSCVQRLEPKEQELIRLRFYADKTLRATAEAAEMPESTVRKTLQRVFAKLDKCISKSKIEFS